MVDTQAGEYLDWFGPSSSSSAEFGSSGAYGPESAHVASSVEDIQADLKPVYGTTPDTHDVLIQFGSATVSTASGDLQDPSGIIMFGTATSGQNLDLCGNYAGTIQALFSNTADVGVSGITASTAPKVDSNGDKDPLFSAQIDTGDANIVDANLGQSTTVGFQQINAIGAVPTLSGDVQTWGSFSGAYNPNGRDIKDIVISVANEQDFSLATTGNSIG
ncbi:MAG: hypothetical protein ABR985_15180 [Methanotrichaceae archaeon]|jgi:hypothetical protein